MPRNYKYYRKDIMDAVKRVKKSIDDNPGNGSSTATLASEAGISRNVLQEVFKDRFGAPIGQYRLRVRMAHAKYLLSTRISIKEIAITLQYSSLSAFTNAFSKYYGQSPSRFKTK
jgi:AraC-like DNA-binding protein